MEAAADSGELDELCARHQVRVLTAFGSAARGEPHPADLDIAVAFEIGASSDVLGLLDDLVRVAGTERIDLMDLHRAGPVARERGLVRAVPLFESESGAYANAQIAAMMERMETEWLRRLDLELMAE